LCKDRELGYLAADAFSYVKRKIYDSRDISYLKVCKERFIEELEKAEKFA
jgi:hypothetical protein